MKSLVLIKPDILIRNNIGTIITRLESNGFEIHGMRMFAPTEALPLLERHYEEHIAKNFYRDLIVVMNCMPTIALIVLYKADPESTIPLLRNLIGAKHAIKGTIRGDYSITQRLNSIHASDSLESAIREIAIWFPGV